MLADVLRWEGSALRDRGRTSAAEPLYHRSLEISLELGYDAGHAHALNCLASLAQRRGETGAATKLLTESLTIANGCGESRLVGMIQQNLGIVADITGDAPAALDHYEVSLRAFESTNDLQPMCWVLNNLGYLHIKEERYDEAGESFERAMDVARGRGDLISESVIEANRAELALMVGDINGAYSSICRAIRIAEAHNDNARHAAALKQRGAYERLTGRPADAANTLRHAMILSVLSEDTLLGAEILYQFGLARYDEGDSEAAGEIWSTALIEFERIGSPQWSARVQDRLSLGGTGRYL